MRLLFTCCLAFLMGLNIGICQVPDFLKGSTSTSDSKKGVQVDKTVKPIKQEIKMDPSLTEEEKMEKYGFTKEIPDFGYPKYISTGHSETDNHNQAIAIRKWAVENANNPSILNLSAVLDFPGFPIYMTTSNSTFDLENFRKAKKEWILYNQEIYMNNKELIDAAGEPKN